MTGDPLKEARALEAIIAKLEAEKNSAISLSGYWEEYAGKYRRRAEQAEAALAERNDQIRRIHLVLGRATLVWEESISDGDIDVLGLLGKWATPRARAEEGSGT